MEGGPRSLKATTPQPHQHLHLSHLNLAYRLFLFTPAHLLETSIAFMSHSSFYAILSQYPILSILAENLSALDLFHLSLASKTTHSYIQPNRKVFSALTRQSLCDGHGLLARQEFNGPYSLESRHYNFGNRRVIHDDEPIEVHLWAQKCDEANALPCIKCGVNICEECRFLDRIALKAGELYRRPFPHPNWEHNNFIGMCLDCDAKTAKEVSGKFLYEDCVCDAWDRWICLKCYGEETDANNQYERGYTAFADDDYYDSDEGVYRRKNSSRPMTKIMGVHQHSIYVSATPP